MRQTYEVKSELERQRIEIIQLRQEIQQAGSKRLWESINWTSVLTTAGSPIALKIFHSLQMHGEKQKVVQAEHRADQANAQAEQANLDLQKVISEVEHQKILLKTQQQKNDFLETTISQNQAEVDTYQSKCQSYEDSISKLQAEHRKSQNELKDVKRNFYQLSDETAVLKEKLAKTENQSARKELDLVKSESNRLKAEAELQATRVFIEANQQDQKIYQIMI